MSAITRRGALLGVTAAVAVAGVPTAVAAQPDPLLAGVQALVNEIRQGLSGQVIMCTYWALQEAADRLEALPGIQATTCEHWTAEDQERAYRHGRPRTLRGATS